MNKCFITKPSGSTTSSVRNELDDISVFLPPARCFTLHCCAVIRRSHLFHLFHPLRPRVRLFLQPARPLGNKSLLHKERPLPSPPLLAFIQQKQLMGSSLRPGSFFNTFACRLLSFRANVLETKLVVTATFKINPL